MVGIAVLGLVGVALERAAKKYQYLSFLLTWNDNLPQSRADMPNVAAPSVAIIK